MANYQMLVLLFTAVIASSSSNSHIFGGRCSQRDPNVDACLLRSFNSFLKYLKGGAPELGIEKLGPIAIEKLSLVLGKGVDQYRATFKDINATGASDMTITNVSSNLKNHEFNLTLFGPHMGARARYTSRGVLVYLPASGGGEYWGKYDGVKVKVYIRGKPYTRKEDGPTYLRLEQLKLDLSAKNIKMGVENLLYKGDKREILLSEINKLLHFMAQEFLHVMKPELKRSLEEKMSRLLDRILQKIPYDEWIVD